MAAPDLRHDPRPAVARSLRAQKRSRAPRDSWPKVHLDARSGMAGMRQAWRRSIDPCGLAMARCDNEAAVQAAMRVAAGEGVPLAVVASNRVASIGGLMDG